ncbi:tRNA (adenosine(37)-N6)-threonylcarbamoyltransferase complex dimerization subunit type 1 TsaB [Pseudaestuariivita atlantica]|uniref:Peptidase M22 n=1 Tax=Pseudaestuariivita atlantica TaxID=1317121 RepID=A0A0L1JSI1_9RHOB|nr:tRNA (adenosine(37)-N6)-threonylcarbamoyltransferase complex dimerization subunit type 1 TsaB [Pseudaestuariivita atlantica]KNG94353.1 peptidase M22 [Pseudaestuariivita atlantica]
MPERPLTLGFDTSAAHCAAALVSGGRVLVSVREEMARGQAERLMPMIEEMLHSAGVTWQELDRIGCGIGPGNFTGIRISVSAARGLALGLGVRAVGMSSFEALHRDMPDATALVAAPRGQVYACAPGGAPALRDRAEVTGPVVEMTDPARLAEAIALIADAAGPERDAPKPLYLKPADAAPASDPPPVMLDDA